MKDLIEYLPSFIEALKTQLAEDKKRWGDTYKYRPIDGQEDRTFNRFFDYYAQYKNAGTPIPWLKVIGNAFICWAREQKIGDD